MTTEANEPSYYEIALTNRQVLVAFVLILGSVFGAFLCGVWVGKGSGSLLASEIGGTAKTAAAAEKGQLDDIESLRFFSDDQESEEELKKPDLSRLLEEPRAETTLAEDVGAARKPLAAAPPPPPPPSPPPSSPPPATATRPVPAPPPSPPPPAPAAAEGFIVQVFSSHDRAQAAKIESDLAAAGFKTFIAPIDKDGATLYRVRIGPFARRGLAERAEREVKAKFQLETWVTAAGN